MPSRRHLLATGCGLLPVLAGCQSTSDSAPSTNTPSSTTDSNPTTTESTGYTVQSQFEKEAYWLRGVALPQSIAGLPTDEIAALSDLNSSTRNAVKVALTDGPFTTTDPSAALLDGIEDVTFVEYQGTYYDISHTFPTYTLTLDTGIAPENAPDHRTIKRNSDAVRAHDTVEDAITTVTPHGVEYAGQPYVTTQMPDVLRDFLDRYDYIAYPAGVGELVVTITQRSPPHTVTATEASDEQLYGREVLELDSFTATGRDLIRRTLDSHKKTPLGHDDDHHSIFPEDIPDQLDRRLENESYFVRVDGTIYGFDARHLHWHDLPFDVTATLVDESLRSESPARIKLEATNRGSRTAELVMSGVVPFGVLWAYGPSGEHVLWTPEYENTDDISRDSGNVIPEFQDEVTVPANESVDTVYQFGRDYDRIEPGDYAIAGLVWAKWPTESSQEKYDWRSEIYPYTLTLSVT